MDTTPITTAPDTGEIHLALPARLGMSYVVRALVRELLAHAAADAQTAFRLVVTVDELFSNAVRHGSSTHADTVHVHLHVTGDTLYATIADEGRGKATTPDTVREQLAGKAKQATETSGRGLSMFAKEWTDDVHVAASVHGGIAVSICKRLHPHADVPPA